MQNIERPSTFLLDVLLVVFGEKTVNKDRQRCSALHCTTITVQKPYRNRTKTPFDGLFEYTLPTGAAVSAVLFQYQAAAAAGPGQNTPVVYGAA